jgi:hypothetical protein
LHKKGRTDKTQGLEGFESTSVEDIHHSAHSFDQSHISHDGNPRQKQYSNSINTIETSSPNANNRVQFEPKVAESVSSNSTISAAFATPQETAHPSNQTKSDTSLTNLISKPTPHHILHKQNNMATVSVDSSPATNRMSSSFMSTDGYANGVNGSSRYGALSRSGLSSPKPRMSSSMSFTRGAKTTTSHSGGYKISLISETATSLKKKSSNELGAGVSHGISSTTFVQFVEWIRSERLASLPHKGSTWDKVLIRALYFAEQLNGFDENIRSFALDSNVGAELGYGHAKLLLEVSATICHEICL